MSTTFVRLVPAFSVAVPLMAAAVLAPFTRCCTRAVSSVVTTVACGLVLGMTLFLLFYSSAHGTIVHWMGGWEPSHGTAIGISFAVDPMGAGLAAFVALLVLCATVYTWIAVDLVGTLLHVLLLAFLGAMCGYALTGDLFNMFVWFELMTAAAIALTSHKIEEASSISGAINLAVTNSLGGFLVLFGIALLYGKTDALNLAQIGEALAKQPIDAALTASFALIVCGYFVKGAVAPFHFWLDDAHAVAPTPVCLLFSGIMVQLALYGVARIYFGAFAASFAPHVCAIGGLFLGVGIATALLGALMAYAQRHLKRLLAFSTVSHSGMFVAAIGLFQPGAIAATALFIAAHGLVKSALFVCAGTYLNRFRSLDECVLGGRGREAPANSAMFLIGGVALAACPPFAISVAKAAFDRAMDARGLAAVSLLMALVSAIDAGAVLRSGLHITFGIGNAQDTGISPREEEPETIGDHLESTPWTMLAVPAALLALALWLGVDERIWHGIERAGAVFVDRHSYVGAVLGGHSLPLPDASGPKQTAVSLTLNLSATALAIAIALAGLFRHRIPRQLKVASRPFAFLRNLHSGKFADYVAYLMVGVAAYGCWLVVALPR